MSQAPAKTTGNLPDINQRNADWYIDKIVQHLVFLSGISAIILIVGIFIFVTIEGLGFFWKTSVLRSSSCRSGGNRPTTMNRHTASWH